MIQLFKSEKEKESLSILKNPFTTKSIIQYSTFACYYERDNTWSHSGRVKFKNGMTEGEQKFEAESFGLLVKQMEEFIKSLS